MKDAIFLADSDDKKKSKLYLTLFFVVLLSFSLGFTLVLTHYKCPNDGIYYISVADSLVTNGRLLDISTVPPSRLVTPQVGIIYFIALLKIIFGSYWIVLYIILISFLWAIALSDIFKTMLSVLHDRIFCLIVVSLLFFDYVVFKTNLSFSNESVYYPVFFFFCSYSIRRAVLSSEKTLLKKDGKIIFNLALMGFLIFGIFFRLHHIVVLLALTLYVAVFERDLLCKILVIDAVSIGLIGIFCLKNPMPFVFDVLSNTRDFLLTRDMKCKTISLISQSVFYLHLNKIFHCNILNLAIGLIGLFILVCGAIYLKKGLGNLFFLYLLFIFASLPFLIIQPGAPHHVDRYSMPLHFFILLFTYLGLQNILKDRNRMLCLSIIILIMVFVAQTSLIYSYFIGRGLYKDTRVRRALTVHEIFRDDFDPSKFLIYSHDNRITYWILQEPVGTVEPDNYATLGQASPNTPVIYIGPKRLFYDFPWSGEYTLGLSLVTPREDYGVWQVFSNNDQI